MKLTVYRPDGTALFDIIPDASSGHDWSLMTDNRLSLSFESENCTVLMPGCYVDFDGIRYYIIEEYKPTLVNSMQWKYNVTFKDAASWLAITIALNTIDEKNTPIFQYTAPAAEHAAIIVANLNRRMNTTAWTVGSVIDTGNISIDYNGKYCADVLQELVDGEDTEWWVEGMTLNIGRAEFGNTIELGYRQGLLGNITCAQSDNMRSYAYLFPVGSTRNIDPTKYGYDRLQLPNGQTRVDMNVEQGVAELVEEKAFSHIFPRYIGKVTNVATSTGTSEDGEPFLIYFIEDKNIPFNPNDYELPGAVKHIIFQSGELMGSDFEVNYNATTHQFEIITQWPNGGGQLPGGLLIPAIGDEYVVWNISMPDEYYPRASQEFLEAAEAFAASAIKDASVYKATLDYIDARERGLSVRPGQRVRLLSDEYFSSGYYDSRITRITRKLDLPDAITIDVSAVRVIGTIQKLQNSLQSTASQVAQVTNTVQTVVQNVTNAVSLTGNQLVRGMKDFVDGLKIGGLPIRRINENTVFIDANVAFGGAATMFGKGSTTFPTIWANIPIDGNTIGRNEQGELYVIGGTGGGGGVANSVAWANVTGKPDWIGASKPSYTYSEITGTPDLTIYATQSSVDAISTKLNDFLEGEDADTIINKWKELESVLSGLKESDNLATILSGKADTAEFEKYILKDTAQEISAIHNFKNGLLIDGLAIKKSQDKTIYIDGNLVISGAMTMFGKDSTTSPSIFDLLPIDNETIKRNENGQLYAVAGGVGSGGGNGDASDVANGLVLERLADLNSATVGRFFTSATGGDSDSGNRPNKGWITGLTLGLDGQQLYARQLAFDASDGIYYRRSHNGTWHEWNKILTESNYTKYALPITGGTVNGDVTISGTLASAKLSVNNTSAWSGVFNTPNTNIAIANADGFGLAIHALTTADENKHLLRVWQGSLTGATGSGKELFSVYSNGATNVGGKLYVGTESDSHIYLKRNGINYIDANGSLRFTVSGYSTLAMELTTRGNVAIGGASGSEKLDVKGNVKATGGIIETDSIAGLTVYRTNDIYSAVHFYNTQNGQKVDVGYLGATANRKPVYIDSGGTNYDLLHSNNYSSYALPLSGGTINGNCRFVLQRKGDQSSIVPNATALTISTNSAGHTGYNTGIGFNALGDYSDTTFKNHIHAWIGLGSATTTLAAECYPLVFATNGSTTTGASPIERMRITPEGNIVIGGATASAKFDVYNTSGWTSAFNTTKSAVAVSHADGYGLSIASLATASENKYLLRVWQGSLTGSAGTGKELLRVGSNGLTTVGGDLLITGAVTFFSQASLKNVINHEGLSLDELARIRPARFKWKDGRDNRVHVGVIAENILPILPEVVYFTGEEKTMTVDYASLATHIGVSLIQPVVNLAERVKYLEAEVKALKQENNKLKQLIA